MSVTSTLVDALIELAIAEDCSMGDVTADALIPKDSWGTLRIFAKEPCLFCGAIIVEPLLRKFNISTGDLTWHVGDGEFLEEGDVVLAINGASRTLLTLERPLLNFIQHLSGISTLTRRYVNAIQHTSARLLDTRKTTPGFRVLEKYATRVGGAVNHRLSLSHGWLIKENHIHQVGGVKCALDAVAAYGTHGLKVEIEVETFEELAAAVAGGADIVLLDNFSVGDVREAVAQFGRQVVLEASGGINLSTIAAYAETGVHSIAVGSITHSALAIDFSAHLTSH